ncbi:hypothetical protein LTR10_001973 [Elasticomyces elasticus]|nr:hypothetical protein LTR10_001973 [Elasticomyces elasticus]
MTPSDYPLLGSSQAALPSLQSAPAIHQRGTQHTQPQPAYGDPYSSQTRAAPSGLQGPPTRSYDSTPFGPPSPLPHPPSSHPQATSVQRATASDLLKPIGVSYQEPRQALDLQQSSSPQGSYPSYQASQTGLNSPSAYQPPLQSNSVASPRFIPAEQQRPPASPSVPPLNSASIPRTDFAQLSTSQQALLSPPSSAQPNRSTLLPQHQTRNSYTSSYQADPHSQALGSASLSPQQQSPSHYTGGRYAQPHPQWPRRDLRLRSPNLVPKMQTVPNQQAKAKVSWTTRDGNHTTDRHNTNRELHSPAFDVQCGR